jgi:hypothetical protein
MRGLDHDVAGTQAVNRLAIGIETEETPIRGHVDPFAEPFVEPTVRSGQPILEEIGHSYQLRRPRRRRKSIADCAAPTPAAPDQRHLYRVVFGGIDARNGARRQNRSSSDATRVFEKLPTTSALSRVLSHNHFAPNGLSLATRRQYSR